MDLVTAVKTLLGVGGKKKQEPPASFTFMASEGTIIMANVKLNWAANAVEENVSGYIVYKNGSEIARPTDTTYTDLNVTPGQYLYEVAPVNAWGDGPKSDPVKTPKAASKVTGVIFSIEVNISA